MAKCIKEKLHKNLWRIKAVRGSKVVVFCLACEFEWESSSDKLKSLPRLSDDEKGSHLVGKHD